MALFDIDEDPTPLNAKADGIKVDTETEEEQLRLSGKYQALTTTIGEIEHGKTTHFVTSGAWSMHDLVRYIVERIGPCKMDAFTFAWGPAATRTIGKMIENGQITKIRIAINTVMKRWQTPAVQKMSDYGQVVKIPIHAKGFTLINDEWKISCLGSANFSYNQTIEGGVICTLPEVCDFHQKWLDHLFETGEEFLVDKEIDQIGSEISPLHKSDHVLFLLRGLPGAGKSTLAHHIADVVCENDDFFSVGGRFRWDAEQIPWAKAECYMHVREAMETDVKRIAVANCFIDEAGLEQYYRLADQFGYSVFCVVVENRTGNWNIHGVGDKTIANMRKRLKVKL